MKLVGKDSLATPEAVAAFDVRELLGAGSWSCFELVRAAKGRPVTAEDMDVVALAAFYSGEIRRMMEDGITGGLSTDGMNRIGFVDTIVASWMDRSCRGTAHWAEWHWNISKGFDRQAFKDMGLTFNYADGTSKIKILRDISTRFPYLLVKYYATKAADLHRSFGFETLTITKLIEASSVLSEDVKRAVRITCDEMNSRSAFMA